MELKIDVDGSGSVSALLDRPDDARWLLVLAHGAGAGMRHRFMGDIVRRLNDVGFAVLRYQFPYMEAGGKRVDRPPVAHAAVRAAVSKARELESALPLFAGGKSFGGRMTSQAMAGAATADSAMEAVRGLVFFGFPLHPAGKPGSERAEHLADVKVPMLFLQGTRDALADLELIRGVTDDLSEATLHVEPDADHSFAVRKSSGRDNQQVLDSLAAATADWAQSLG